MYIVDNIINIVTMFVIDTSAKTLTITLAQSAVVKVRFNIDEIYSSTGASHVINLPIKDGMIATGAYVAIIDGVETLLPYSYPTEEPNIVWDENGLLSTMAVGDNTAYLGTIVIQSIVCTPPAPLVEKTGTSSVSYDPNIYSGTWIVRRTLELSYDQGNGLTTKKSIDVTDSHIVYNTNVQALYDAVSVFIQDYIDGCSLCKDSSVFMKLNGYMELFNGYWINGSYEKAYDALYEAGKFVNLSSATVEIEPMMNGIAVHIQNFNNPHKTSFSNIEGYPLTPTNNRFLRDDKTFAEIALRHSQLILPNEDVNVQHLTDAEKAELHTHTNKSVLDTITSVLVSGWNAAATWVSTYGANVLTHISDGSLHVTQALLNTISNKVDKVEGKGLSTNDFTNEQKELLSQQSGTNTGDQDLSGLESKRGTDDFYLTNAEKTQGALATGNTTLDTVKKVADFISDRVIVDITLPSDTSSIIIENDKNGKLLSELNIKKCTIYIQGSSDNSTTTRSIGLIRINNISEKYKNGNITNSSGFYIYMHELFISKSLVDIVKNVAYYSLFNNTSLIDYSNPASIMLVGYKENIIDDKINKIQIISATSYNLLAKTNIKIYSND